MAKLIYYYGVMNSAKTALLLTTAHNYENTGRKIVAMKPNIDTRDSKGKISSRIGLSREAIIFTEKDSLINIVEKFISDNLEKPSAILIDEVQFCTKEHIKELAFIVDNMNIDVLCYGLKSTYTGELFEASAKLFILADKIERIKQVCSFCNKKAIMNLKIRNNKPVYSGESISIGDINNCEEYYIPVCRQHYNRPYIKK